MECTLTLVKWRLVAIERPCLLSNNIADIINDMILYFEQEVDGDNDDSSR